MDMTSEEQREKKQKIRELRADLSRYKATYSAAKVNLELYAKNYEKYTNAKSILDTVKTSITEGADNVSKGNSRLPSYASGNKFDMATGIISAVEGMFRNTAASVDIIKTFMEKDMEVLNEKYIKLYSNYINAVDGYNRTVNKLRGYGENCAKIVASITKKKLQ